MIALSAQLIARSLGGVACGNRVFAPGPGHSNRDRSLVVLVDAAAPAGFVVTSFAGDDWRDCKSYVRERLGMPDAWVGRDPGRHDPSKRHPSVAPRLLPPSDTAATDLARAIWRQARPVVGTPAWAYLTGRGLPISEAVIAADVLRFHPACPFGRERLPAMVALMRAVGSNEPRAIHRTAIKPDGSGKAQPMDGGSSKRMLGPAGGCVVKLIADAEVTIGLGVAEGIENALSAICAGWSPVWAAGCKDALAKFPVLAGLEALTVFSDPEPRGVEAARCCARRWQEAGRETTVVEPNAIDSDLNDLLGHNR